MIVVADTSPINFLVLIGEQDILAALFGRVIIPKAVHRELEAAATPAVVRKWIGSQPRWIEIRTPTWVPDPTLSHLDEGEREAIQLVEELRADLLLVDERAGRREAAKRS